MTNKYELIHPLDLKYITFFNTDLINKCCWIFLLLYLNTIKQKYPRFVIL